METHQVIDHLLDFTQANLIIGIDQVTQVAQ